MISIRRLGLRTSQSIGGMNVATLPANLGAITLFVDDVTRAKGFYRDVFDLSPIYEDENAAA